MKGQADDVWSTQPNIPYGTLRQSSHHFNRECHETEKAMNYTSQKNLPKYCLVSHQFSMDKDLLKDNYGLTSPHDMAHHEKKDSNAK